MQITIGYSGKRYEIRTDMGGLYGFSTAAEAKAFAAGMEAGHKSAVVKLGKCWIDDRTRLALAPDARAAIAKATGQQEG